MDVRGIFIFLGLVLIFGSSYFGDWAIWLGAPLLFMGIILYFLDKG